MGKLFKRIRRLLKIKRYSTMQSLVVAIEQTKKGDLVKMLRHYRSRIPCTDCKRIYNWKVMTFDHLDRGIKTKGVMDLASANAKKRLLEELPKCELVCLNCHKLREYVRDWQPATEADLRNRIGNGVKL